MTTKKKPMVIKKICKLCQVVFTLVKKVEEESSLSIQEGEIVF